MCALLLLLIYSIACQKHPQRIILVHIPNNNTQDKCFSNQLFKKMTVKLPLTQVSRHSGAGAFIPPTHVKSSLKYLFRKTNVFYYWQLLIILFADDRTKKIMELHVFVNRERKNIFLAARGRFWRNSAASTSIWYTLPSHVTIIARIGCGLRKEKVEK